jgi:ferredoxin
MKRKIIQIDEEKCTGCAKCVPNCPEGAIQIIDGKARLVSDLFCDGLGACLGHCPEGAITIEEREAEKYDERKVMENIVRHGPNTIRAHLAHLRDHNQMAELSQALAVLKEKGIPNPMHAAPAAGAGHAHAAHGGCPGSRSMEFAARRAPAAGGRDDAAGTRPSQLGHWPVQLHLMSPTAPQYQGADVLLSADCVAYALGDFHKDYLRGKALAIACPKLDEGQEVYVEKIRSLIDDARINTLTVMIMEVPCCMGLLNLAQEAARGAARKVPVKCITVGIQGDIQGEEWVAA